MSPVDNADLKEIQDLYSIAEKSIKRIEIYEGLAFPPVNELRYVGQHLLVALNSSDADEIKNNVHEANDHCRRSIYDAKEIGILYLLRRIMAFQERNKFISITEIFPEYISMMQRVSEIQKFVLDVNRKKLFDDENLQLMENIFGELIKFDELITIATNEINKKYRNLIIKGCLSFLAASITIIIALIGTLIALLTLLLR